MIGHIQAIAQLQAMGGLTDMDIQVTVDNRSPRYWYVATDSFDLRMCGQGRTPLDAIIDLLDQKEEG